MAEFTFAPLTPGDFLQRSAAAFSDREAVVDGDLRLTYRDFATRCAQLVSALAATDIHRGDRVAALCSNSHIMLELHHAVPMRSAVLVPINTRLSEQEMHHILQHSGATLLVATEEYATTAHRLAASTGVTAIVEGGLERGYESWISAAEPVDADRLPVDETQLLAINYTSGTTGTPKGVMYHHRGAYLQSIAMAYHSGIGLDSRYLWTLPMFHCNGWCYTWAVTAAGGTHVCLRRVDTARIWTLLTQESISHFSAAPTVLTMIAEEAETTVLEPVRHVDTGGSPPSPALLARLAKLGMSITHLYGLTETFGPIAINEWQSEWDAHDESTRIAIRARQGISNLISRPLRVFDAAGNDVPRDGQTIGEVAVQGNNVMLGYYKDDEASRDSTRNGCLLTGDLAVMHPDGYIEIRDRRKDVIISGGENIASIEIEQVLAQHPLVVECAVVACADPQWGEVPVAFVTTRVEDQKLTQEALIAYSRQHLAGYKVPKRVLFGPLPRNSTGKIQKNLLRRAAEQRVRP